MHDAVGANFGPTQRRSQSRAWKKDGVFFPLPVSLLLDLKVHGKKFLSVELMRLQGLGG